MKKKRTIEETICDFCAEKAKEKCKLCKRDVCNKCARWICRKESHPVSGGPSIGFGLQGYNSYPWQWKPEKILCKDCVEKFKMSIAMLAGKENEKES